MVPKHRVHHGPFLKSVALKSGTPKEGYPWNLAAVRDVHSIDFRTPVTLLVGDNGSGKSTLIEAIAKATGFNTEGGNRHFTLEERATVSQLAKNIELHWTSIPKHGWFLRAESFYNVASFIEEDPELLSAYDDESFHELSHGESFIDLALKRFSGNGFLFLMSQRRLCHFKGVFD